MRWTTPIQMMEYFVIFFFYIINKWYYSSFRFCGYIKLVGGVSKAAATCRARSSEIVSDPPSMERKLRCYASRYCACFPSKEIFVPRIDKTVNDTCINSRQTCYDPECPRLPPPPHPLQRPWMTCIRRLRCRRLCVKI